VDGLAGDLPSDSTFVSQGNPDISGTIDFSTDPEVVRVVAEAFRLGYGYLFNPAFATEISLIDPLPHQRIAVYDHMLTQPRLRFLLADEPGGGKTIMAGLYIREMLARRLIRRILIIPPAGLIGSAGIEAAEGAGSRKRVPRDPAQSGRLERAAGGGVEEDARVGERSSGPDTERGRIWAK
jgi:hypothetical protein